ncbi:aldo/keto reductase [Paenibacillus thermotolerans]|uniref:aldo/keto reductase n=1 Tax=Paenibacillus thermotolerans TaxID=3027807 RepID=UPI002367DCC8|nr:MULTISPECIES: aldo/keto reductase [unclassified Paenibacillus]
MRYIEIAGLQRGVSQLILGTDYFRPEILDKIAPIMDEFVKLGGNTFDTAEIYSGGESEKALGQWLKERGNRDSINVWTKGAHPHGNSGPRVTREAIDRDIQVSLDRLALDYVDMYALHRDNPDVPVGPIIEALNEQIEKGRTLAIGCSNWTPERIQEANDYAASHGLVGFSFSSPNLSLGRVNEPYWAGCVSIDDEGIRWHEKTGLPLLSWSSQGRGFFSGRFTPDVRDNSDIVRVFYNEGNWERLRRAKELGEKKGMSTVQIALAYVLNQSFPTCALIGPANIEELHSSYEGAQLTLTEEEKRWLDLSAE